MARAAYNRAELLNFSEAQRRHRMNRHIKDTTGTTKTQVEQALAGIDRLRRSARDLELEYALDLDDLAPQHRASAANLLHYLAVRHHDIRELQGLLARLGLSSLGRMESHTMAALNVVASVLERLLKPPPKHKTHAAYPAAIGFDEGGARLARNAERILGPASPQQQARIMVTMPGEAADDPELIRDLMERGMDIMRINCAHDSPAEWDRMIRHLRDAETALGRRCRISFDLAGPKLRTGPVQTGAAVARWKPAKDELGRVQAPARVVLLSDAAAPLPAGAWPVGGDLPLRAAVGDRIRLTDARGRRRVIEVVEKLEQGCACHAAATAYVTPGTALTLLRGRKVLAKAPLAEFAGAQQYVVLQAGDRLDLMLDDGPGRAAVLGSQGEVLAPAVLTCDLPEVFASVQPGERIFFDDGKIAGMIREVSPGRLLIEILNVVGSRAKLRDEKGINLPDSRLALPALSDKDLRDLAFAVEHADMVAMSFVQRPEDIEQLIAELTRLDAREVGIVLKIETTQAFAELPALLLAAMKHYPIAVMVARGDLGVEVGFERLSEVQEEILWLCEAAHTPVIWATQVLESLAKGGMPSRAEVTDAAMSGRAECVMLNKGPYITQTLDFLSNVLRRMAAHQQKKTAMLRRLEVSHLHKKAKPKPKKRGAKPA